MSIVSAAKMQDGQAQVGLQRLQVPFISWEITAQSPLPASGVGNQRDREGERDQLGQKGGET